MTEQIVPTTKEINIGAAIRVLRLLRDQTQQELGSLVGVSKATVSEIEKGNRNVPVAKLGLYAEALSVSQMELFTIAEAYGTRGSEDFLSGIIRKLCSLIKEEKLPSGGRTESDTHFGRPTLIKV